MRKNYPNSGASPPAFRTAAFSMLGLVLAFATSATCAQDASVPNLPARHAAAIAAARSGQYADAISVLDELRTLAPGDAALLADAIVVRGWAERDAEVVALAEQAPAQAVTLDVARAAAKSARNVRRYDVATRWYERALELDPGALDARVGLAMTQADAGDTAAADATLRSTPDAAQDSAAVRAARAYVRERAGAPLAALNEYDAMLSRDPTDRVALRGKALALRALLLPEQALALAEEHPGVLTDAEMARLKVDRLAVELRLVTRTPYPGSGKHEQAEAALERLDRALPQVTDPAAVLALRLDRVVALTQAGHAAAAVAEFESLPADAVKPGYALIAVSDAYRILQRPADSLRVLQTAPVGDPVALELKFALIYTYLDLEDFDSAFALADRVSTGLPLANSVAGSPVVKANQDRMRAELTAGTAYAYGDQLAQAQTRFEKLLQEAPGNLDLRHELANVYRWRGWLDRSLFEYRQVLTVAPELLPARIGYTYAQIDAREYPQVDTTLAELATDHSREPAVAKLAREWDLHNRGELDVVAATSDSTGSTFGSDSYRVDATWHSRPFAYRWRALVHEHDAYASFPEGDAHRKRLGAGVEYRAVRLTAGGEISAARSSGGETGVRGDVAWRLSDYWNLAALVDLNGNDVPLRGYRVGVEADTTGFTATFAPDESMSVSAGGRAQSYSDDNSARSLFIDGRYRFVNAPQLKLELTGELAASRSDRNDVPYFSPLRDTTLLVGVHNEWRLFRRYERSLTQSADIAVGRYDQAGFSAGTIWRARYAIQWQPSQRFALSTGLERDRRVFDGLSEHSTGIVATLRARL